MATFVASGTQASGNNSAGPLSPGLPAGWAAGDLLIVEYQCFGGTNSRVPSMDGSWGGGTWLNGTASHGLWWKIATSGEGTPSITLTGTGVTGDTQVARCHAFRPGAGKGFQLKTASATHTNASADNVGTIAGLAAADAPSGALVVLSAGKTNDWNGTATLTSWTLAAQSESTTGSDAGTALLYILSAPGTDLTNVTVTDNGATASTGAGSARMVSFVEIPVLAAETGAFTLTGNAAALLLHRKLVAERGIFSLTGNAATLSVGSGGSGPPTIAQQKHAPVTDGTSLTTRSVTLDSAVAVGQFIDVTVTWGGLAGGDENPSGVADDLGGGTPNVYTEHTGLHTFDDSNDQAVSRFTCPVTQAGTPTITVTFAAGRPYRGIQATVVDNAESVDTGAMVAQFQSGTTAPASGNVTPDTAGSLILSTTWGTALGANTITLEGGATSVIDNGGTDAFASQYKIHPTATAVNSTFTYGSSDNGHTSAIAYRPTAGGGGLPALALLPSSGILGGMRQLYGGLR